MSNIIGIKANLALNRSKLDKDISEIQEKISSNQNLFKINVDANTVAQLTALKAELKEIIAMAGKGVKIKIDTKVVQEAQQTTKNLEASLDKLKRKLDETTSKFNELGNSPNANTKKKEMVILSEDMQKYKEQILETQEQLASLGEGRKKSDASAMSANRELEDATERAQKVTRKYWQDTNNEVSRTLVNMDALGNAVSTTWSKDGDGNWFKGTIQDSDNIEILNKKFDTLKTNIGRTKLEYDKLQASMSATQKNEATKQNKLMNLAMSKTDSDVLKTGDYDNAEKQAQQYEKVQKAIALSTTEAVKFKKEIATIKFSNPDDAAKLEKELSKLANMTDLDKVTAQVSSMSKTLSEVKLSNTFEKSLEKVSVRVKKLNKETDSLKQSQNEMGGFKSDKDGGIAEALKEVEAQRAIIDNAGNQTSQAMVNNYQGAVNTYKELINLKQSDLKLSDMVGSKQSSLNSKLFAMKKFMSDGLMTQGQYDELEKAIEMLSKAPNTTALKASAKDIESRMTGIKNSATDAYGRIQNSGSAAHGLKRISDAMAKVGLYFSSWRLTSEVFQELKRGIGVIAEIDNQIVQVGIDMDITASQATKLTKEAMRIASETGIAIDQIIRVAGVYSNATEDMDSVLKKVKPSAILAGVSGADATQITDMFQGVVNQYKLGGEDIEATSYQISDAIIGVSKNLANNFDDSVKEISETMLDAGAVMEELGYTYQETMAMAGSVMEVTRQTGSEMGGAFRMIGARIGGAKNTGEDVDSTEISNAAKAYKALGIEIIDTNNNFKPMKQTLLELSAKWEGLTDVERSYIAEASAGNRRRNTFMVLMNTMAKQTDLTTIAMNSQGDTIAANAKYMESTGAKAQNFKNAMDEMWMSTINSEVSKFFIDLGTTTVKLMTQIGGLKLVMSGLMALVVTKFVDFKGIVRIFDDMGDSATKSAGKLIALKTASGATIISLNLTALAAGALQAVLSFGLSFAISTAIGLLAGFIDKLHETSEEAKVAAEEISDVFNKHDNNASDAQALINRQRNLESMGNAGTKEEQIARNEELNQIYIDLAKILPSATTEYDEFNNALAKNIELSKEKMGVEEEAAKKASKAWLDKQGYGSTGDVDARNAELQALKAEQQELNAFKLANPEEKKRKALDTFNLETHMMETSREAYVISEKELQLNEEILAMENEIASAGDYAAKAGDDALKTHILTLASLNSAKTATEGIAKAVPVERYRSVLKSVTEYNSLIDESTSRYEELQGMIDNISKKGGAIDQDTIDKAIKDAPHLIQYLGDENAMKAELIRMQKEEGLNMQELHNMRILAMSVEEKMAYRVNDAKTMEDTEYYNSQIKNNETLINEFKDLYGIDLKNYNSLAEAKNAIDMRYVSSAIANYNQLILKSKAYQQGNTHEQFKVVTTKSGGVEITENPNWTKSSSATNALNAMSYTPTFFDAVGKAMDSANGSSKDKEDQSYTSDTVDYNRYVALIEEHQKQLDVLDRKIAKVTTSISNLNDIGSESALQQSLTKQNELYKLQIERVALLKSSQATLASQQGAIGSAMASKYGVNMNALTEEDKNYYLDKLYPEITSTNENLINQRNDAREAFSQMFDDWMTLASEGLSLNDALIESEGTLIQMTKDKYETEFSLMDKKLDRYKEANAELANELAMLNDTSSFNERENLMSQSIQGLNVYRQQLEGVISDLTNQQRVLGQGTLEWQLINDQIVGYEDTLQSTNSDILSMQASLKSLRIDEYNASMTTIDKMVATLRKEYEEAKKAELDALKAGLDAEVKSKTAEIDLLQKRLDALNDTTADKAAELQALRDEQALWEQDDSIEAKRNLMELEKLIKDAELELEKDNIQAQIDNLDGEVEAIEATNDEKIESVTKYYEDLMQEQALYNQAMSMFTSMSQDEILAYLLAYDEKYKGMGSILGKSFAEGLLEEIKKGIDGFTSLSDGLMGSELITWLTQLPENYNYDSASSSPNMTYSALGDSVSTMNSGVDTVAMNAMIETLRSYAMKDGLMNLLTGGVNMLDLATSGMDLSNLFANANLNTTIGSSTINMPVNFYTNGQIDIDRSINQLETMLQNVRIGSGVMLSTNK